jgi:glycosyltransferase involved in cell wall biosynthesis
MACVSVIVTVYNGAAFVAAALDSALAQTHPEVEILVIDDGSTDDSARVLERFAARVTLMRQANAGVCTTRNRALRMARGPYVAFLDYDDLWEPNFLARLVARLDGLDDSVAGVVGGWKDVDRDNVEIPGARETRPGVFGLRELAPAVCFPNGAVVLRLCAVRDAGGYDPAAEIAEDWDLWFRIALSGATFVGVDELLWRRRVHQRNISGNLDRMRADVLRMLARNFSHPGVPEQIRALRPVAYRAFLHSHVLRLFRAGSIAAGERAFRDMVHACPEILRDEDLYWATVCADQPPAQRGTRHGLDLDAGARRIGGALAATYAEPALPDRTLRSGQAYGQAYRALAQLAYGQRRMGAARGYAIRALRADRELWRDRRLVGLVLKSLAGGRLVSAARGWRRTALRPRS